MSGPKLSVCIPVYNGQEFIRETIDSVLNQSFKDFEIVIVDNQSIDNTTSIVKSYSDPRIKLFINDTNIGMIPNWNKAMEHATGKYIKILPADDFIYPGCLEKQVKIMDADTNEKISMVCGRRNIIDESGKILFNRGFTKTECEVTGFAAINKNVRSGGNIIGEGGAIIFRKSILKKSGNFNSDIFYVLDIDLWYKILLHGNLYALPDVVSSFRVSKSSASVNVVKKQREDLSNFINKIYLNKEYQLSWLSCKIGLFKAFALTEAKKILYKYVLK
ncbi:MAG: glycosyltransferase [Bacteroidia bacterium]|nr:glycosyltransferase [Bacteroidia bacterium]